MPIRQTSNIADYNNELNSPISPQIQSGINLNS